MTENRKEKKESNRKKGKRDWTNNQDAIEGGREKGREKGLSWIDIDGSYRSYISINYEYKKENKW